jgi:hypothetical protein
MVAAGATLPVAVTERGYAAGDDVSSWWTTALQERTPELRWPFCIDVFDTMRHQDAQVSSVLRAVTAPIQRTQFRVDGTGCRPEVVQLVAQDLGLPVVGEGDDVVPQRGRGRFSWREHLRLALLMLPFGHMYFEQVYRYEAADGYYHLRKLGPRMHRTIAKVNVARDGGLVSIEQYAANGTSTVTLPVNRLVAYVMDREGGDWLGTSLLRPAYKNWLLKDRMLRTQAMTIERNGLGIPVYEAATEDPKELAAGEDIAAGVRAGEDAGAATPAGAKLRLMTPEGQLPDANVPIRYHDEQIARAVLAHFLNLGTQTGSWALGDTLQDFFAQSLHAVCEIVRDTASLHIVEDLVEVNFGPDEVAPRLVFDEIGANSGALVNAIAMLVAAGVLKADEPLEQFIRTDLGLPPRAAVPAPPAAAPVPEEVAS